MTYQELKNKYYNLENEYKQIEIDHKLFKNPFEKKLNEHPCQDTNWIDYARDQKFNFSCLILPCEDDTDWYKCVHRDFEEYLKLMTIHKCFTICKNCGTRWTLDIQLDGKYIIYDQCGKKIVDFEKDESDGIASLYELPRRIRKVQDLMYVIDVIECNSHLQ